MIIKFDGIKNVLPEELGMIINISNEVREKQCRGSIRDVRFVVSSNEENDLLEVNIKIARSEFFNCFNKQDKKRPENPPKK